MRSADGGLVKTMREQLPRQFPGTSSDSCWPTVGLQNMSVTAGIGTGSQVRGGLATIERMPSNAVASHYKFTPSSTSTRPRRDAISVAWRPTSAMQRRTRPTTCPKGASVALQGQLTTTTSAYHQLFVGLAFAIVLI